MNWLRAFEAAARHLSFTAAAGELNLTPAAVSHQVRSLEEHLEYQLFERLPRSLMLTDMGRAYLPSVRKAFGDLSVSTMGLFGVKGDLSVSVRSTVSFGVMWLAPRLKGFFDRYPEIDVRLSTSNWADSQPPDRTDVDIRYGDGRWGQGEIKLTHDETVIPLCAPMIAPQINTPQDLALFPHIHIMGVEDSWDHFLKHEKVDLSDSQKMIRVDNSMSAMEMSAAGAGISLVFKSLAQPYINSGRLVVPQQMFYPSRQSQYIVLPDGPANARPEVQLFINWLQEEASGA
ncbi:LysR substrate-binding domain-containing protein [Aestuariispira insulae]|uniref:LysR substrate-binding domain-containing protein n=1 Tax=Aestuariispira insulae TaxID=1461337 RepID=UPI0024822538|nr:LysR substrate-binding domain-containing protein [Aestuariispira insulae]